MIRLSRFSVLATLALALLLPCLAAPWMGGRGYGNRGSFPEVPFPMIPAVVWKAYLGEEFIDLTPSNVLVAAGNVIVAYNNYVIAVSTETGERRWQYELFERPVSDLLLLNNMVIATSPHGVVSALNPVNGTLVWKHKLSEGVRNGPVPAPEGLFFTTKSNTIEVLDINTGKLLASTNAQKKIEAGPAIVGRSVVLFHTDGYGIRVEENAISRWTVVLPNTVGLTPATDNRLLVVVSSPNGIFGLNPNDRDRPIYWSYPCLDRIPDSAILDGNRVYTLTRNKIMLAIDAATGKDCWFRTESHFERGKEVTVNKPGFVLPAKPIAQPLVIGDYLVIRMESGLMAVYRKDTGKQVWAFTLMPPAGAVQSKNPYMGGPAVVDDDLYFAGTDAVIYHLSKTVPDIDAPTFSVVTPDAGDIGFINAKSLEYLGAAIVDEGSGVQHSSVTLRLDRMDLTSNIQYDAQTKYYYVVLPANSELAPGMHRMVMIARDYRGNTGTLSRNFIIGGKNTGERVTVKISGEFVPKVIRVQPGGIISWENISGGPRTVVSDAGDLPDEAKFTSDAQYPDGIPDKESWVWLVPDDLEIGTKIYYHCRLNGHSGDGESVGTGLAGVIEVSKSMQGAPVPDKPAHGDDGDDGQPPPPQAEEPPPAN